ncbi:MAG TPA: sigma-70 family RNA polymerase sigma factor [Labilithrix sp.]|jgi:RNA polymerase sigma-70 factor (ECF subfamily)
MDEAARTELETAVRAMCDRGDHGEAAARLVRGYGPELFGFLAAFHRSDADANDAFSDLAEAVLRGLPRFAWQSTLRTWLYGIARNVSNKQRRTDRRRRQRVGEAGDTTLAGVVQDVRTETAAFLRTEKRTRLQMLRDALPEDDRMLLVLRVDRALAWGDLARVLHDEEGTAPLDDAALTREIARLRKRFQLIKDRLRALAKREGLID